ncbi:MAG: catechol 2,3-dioxygenase-like lactoylglutathione lyase family enzyme [Gammaproteobacteria bacterium]|jgi:catechol 2,3-dioxygenase-like lactoylglutathione lyase family enzyme
MRGLDHIALAVRDLDQCKASFEQLGFTTTPNALHPWGTANSLIQFDRSFIEILSVAQPQKISDAAAGEFSFGDYNRRFLEHHEGMSMLAFSSTDARADQARWRSLGLQTYALFNFSRAATLPTGEQVTVAFTLAIVTHPQMPDAAWFVCQQHFPEHFWKPQYQQHSNTAKDMQCVWMQAENPVQYSDFLARLFAEGEVTEQHDGITLQLDYGRVAIRTPQSVAERFPGMDLPSTANGPRFVAVTIGAGEASRAVSVYGLIVERTSL